MEDEDSVEHTPASVKQLFNEEGSAILVEKESIESSSSSSITPSIIASPAHTLSSNLLPPGSPSLKPNRRSVEALRMVFCASYCLLIN